MLRKHLLATTTAALSLVCALPALAQESPAPLKVKAVEFTSTPAPATEMEMATGYTRSEAIVTLEDGTKKTFPLSYRVLHRSGDYMKGWYAGLVVDKKGEPIMRTAPDSKGNVAVGPFAAAGADASSMLVIPNAKVDGVKGHTVFLINHLEYDTEGKNADPSKPPVDLYGQLPMAMNLTVLDQDPKTGILTPIKLTNVDFSSVDGLWIPCNGSTTPWMTHLGSEEYEPDARFYENKPLEAMNLYLGTVGKTAAEGGAKPYQYGHLVEVTVQPDGSTKVAKHYAMGRLAFELGDVMADQKTVYYGDDGDDVIRAMFVADKPGDLSAGTLYAAKWVQEQASGFGKAKLQWINLGHATNDEIKAIIDKGTKFSDIFETATAEAVKADPAKHAGFKAIYVYAGTGGKTTTEYLKVKPGMEKAAAFLESRRYAALRGATTEFTKMEGQAHNAADKKLYTVISYIRKSMIDGQNEARPQDDIKLTGDEKDLTCGAVYESTLIGGQKDADGKPISSDWVAADMNALVYGASQPKDAKSGKYDKCDTEKVANPDNVRFSEAMRTLFIGEDSGNHLNNFVWAFNVDTGKLARIFSGPAGGENTGLSVYDNVNGAAYITGNIQHPGATEDLGKYPPEVKDRLRRMVDERGAVGYFSGLPAMVRATPRS
ncbi:PhoX family protein [Microvirga sp. 2TAF3]|uniref:PhoX family protein n=1 Tax=Microvirga sp. 2TAF3 TaxID=3233014 RepID=UPI003F9E40DB